MIHLRGSVVAFGLASAAALAFAFTYGGGRASASSAPSPAPSVRRKRTPKQAAADLYELVTHVPIDWGSRALPNEAIRAAQRDMGVTADGVYGPKTKARGEALLLESFPARPDGAGKLPSSASSSSIPSHAVVLDTDGNAIAIAPQRMPARSAAPSSSSARVNASPPRGIESPLPSPLFQKPERSAREAARALLNYVTPLIRDGRQAELGTAAQPNDTIANAQRDMRIASDGIYGPRTAARGKELLGTRFPSRTKGGQLTAAPVPPPPPAPDDLASLAHGRAPQQAAADLYELVTHAPIQWGTREQPNEEIRRAQLDMGKLTADGVYGGKTQARAAALLRQAFPPRPKGYVS